MRWILTLGLMAMAQGQQMRVYIGTYTHGASKGIYSYAYDEATGALTDPLLAGMTVSPSFLAMHPDKKTLYAVNESRRYNGKSNSGSVSAFRVDLQSGALTMLNAVPTMGADPCHLTVDVSGRWLFVANYSGGSVAVFPLKADGSLGDVHQLVQLTGGSRIDPLRQEAAHAHSVYISPDNKLLYVADLGNDQILIYHFDAAAGKLSTPTVAKLKPGSGPRHLAFSRDRRYFYAISELAATVTVLRNDAVRGTLTELQTVSIVPAKYKGEKSGAEIEVDPSGRFLYASNRGSNSIAVFSIDGEQGRLTAVGQVETKVKTPRHFAVDPEGKHLIAAGEDSSDLEVFAVDPDTGMLKSGARYPAPEAVCVLFVR